MRDSSLSRALPRSALSAAAIAAGLVLGPAVVAQIVQTTRVSVASDGTPGNGSSTSAALSADGRFIAFASGASNLVAGDTRGHYDVFVHDRDQGQTVRVSLKADGTEATGSSFAPAISANGRWVAFYSSASLVPDDLNNRGDVYLHDRLVGDTVRVSVSKDGTDPDNGSDGPSISADGRIVAFTSSASNLVATDSYPYSSDVFVRDMWTGVTRMVSVDSDGQQRSGGSAAAAISADGRFVAFHSLAALVPDDTKGRPDVFVHEIANGRTTRVSVASDGSEVDGSAGAPAISADGRFVAFDSDAPTLVPGDTNSARDVFVHDRQTGQTARVSVASTGTQGDLGSALPEISADGRFVAFVSSARTLVPGDTNAVMDIFVHDRLTNLLTRASVASGGTQLDGDSGISGLDINSDGTVIGFESRATNLVPGDTNDASDVFVRAVAAPQPPGAPSHLGVQIQGLSVSFTWTAPATGGAVETYVLAYGFTPGATDASYSTLSTATSLSHPLENAIPGTYYVRVSARNSLGTGPPSNEVVVRIGPPGPPANLTATVNAPNVRLDWSPANPGPVEGHVLRGGFAPGATSFEFALGPGNTFSSGVPDGVYFVRIHARNRFGIGPASSEVEVRVGCPEAPAPPQSLSSQVNGRQVVLTWLPPSAGCPLDSYVIEAGSQPATVDVYAGDVGKVTTLTASAPPGAYYVAVRGRNRFGLSSISNMILVTVQ